MSLFDKVAVFTDIHFGDKSNSVIHNQDCLSFIDYVISRSEDCETCIFMGDWHHQRNAINTLTLHHSYQGFKKLSENFEFVYIIVGNHDMPYRERRDMHSLEIAKSFENIVVIEDIIEVEGVALIPYLVNDEWKQIQKLKARYLFGHLEVPGFIMSGTMEMRDKGKLNREQLQGFEYVFSGHFHKRQRLGNVIYIGNCFPHNYGDSFEEKKRGFMHLKWGGKPEFFTWNESPKYRFAQIEELLHDADEMLDSKSYVKALVDINQTAEDFLFIRNTLMHSYNLREISILPMRSPQNIEDDDDIEIEAKNVNEIITEELENVDSNVLEPTLLIDIYNSLSDGIGVS